MAINTAASIGIAVGAILLVCIMLFCCVRKRDKTGDIEYQSSKSHHRRCKQYDDGQMEGAGQVWGKYADWQRQQDRQDRARRYR